MASNKARRGRGEGEVEELPSGSFRAVVSLGRNAATGKRERLRKTFPTKKDALAWQRQKLAERDGGTLSSSALTLGAWLDTWLALVKPDVAPKTYEHNESRVRRHLKPRLGAVRFRDLTALKIRQELAAMAGDGVSDSERLKCGNVLRLALNAAVAARQIGTSPMAGVKLPKYRPAEKRAMTAAELRAFLSTAEAADHGHVYRLWADAGLRPGELFALDWEHLSADCSEVTIRQSLDSATHALKEPKTKRSRRTLPLAPSTAAVLRAARPAKGGIFFPGPRAGKRRHEDSFASDVFRPLRERLNRTHPTGVESG